MRVAFLSNYLNHVQLPFCQEMIKLVGDQNFLFIACAPFDVARKNCGFDDMNNYFPWVIRSYEDDSRVIDILKSFDVVISTPELTHYNSIRLETGKLTFFASERLLKRGYMWRWNPLKIWRTYSRINKFKKYNNLFVLCYGAFVAYDYIYSGFPKNRYFTWAYLPVVRSGSMQKNNTEISILWTGRLIDLKRPFDLLDACELLFSKGYQFKITYIGDGPLAKKLKERITQSKYSAYMNYMGSLKNEEVLKTMSKQSILVVTSDRHEGWGAVVNEAMSSGCCVIASDAIGSAPILVQNGTTGFRYQSGNVMELSDRIKFCLDNPEKLAEIQKQAALTMQNDWNAVVAAQRFVKLANNLMIGVNSSPYKEGLCSPALIFKY